MWQELKFNLKNEPGCGLIQHNGDLANPLNPFVKEMKQYTSKRNKTDADHEMIAQYQFLGGLYDSGLGIMLPSEVIEATINGGARKFKEGILAKSGLYVLKDAKLVFEGPQTPKEMWEDGRFTFQKMVVIARSRVLATRPIFNEWSAAITVNFEDEVCDAGQVEKWLKKAGQIVGMCDWRPRYGRFSATLAV